jgi:hypothetical protein
VLDALDFAKLVLDEVEMGKIGVGVRRGRRGVVEGGDGADEVEGEVEGTLSSNESQISQRPSEQEKER